MVNINKLKGKIVENGTTVEKLSEALNINQSTFFRKMRNNGETFTIKEAQLISKLLKLNLNEVNEIFFSQYVAEVR